MSKGQGRSVPRLMLEDAYFGFSLPEDRPFQVIGFGENALDWVCRVPNFPEHDTKVRMDRMIWMGGGQIATACSVCARFGLRTRYVGRVGDDDLGRFVREDLGSEPMDVVLEVVPGAVSHHSIIIVDRPTGGRTIIWDRDPGLRYEPGDLSPEKLIEGQILHLDANDLNASIQAGCWAKEAGMRICLDIDRVQAGVEELVRITDFLIASRSFVSAFGGTSDWRTNLKRVASVCRGFVSVTRGDRGAAVLWDGEVVEFPAFAVECVDSTGAGDMFHGAFIYGVLQQWPVGRIISFANAAGALACTDYGARAAIPALEAVFALERSGRVPDQAHADSRDQSSDWRAG